MRIRRQNRVNPLVWLLLGWGASGTVAGIGAEIGTNWPLTVASILLIIATLVAVRRDMTREEPRD